MMGRLDDFCLLIINIKLERFQKSFEAENYGASWKWQTHNSAAHFTQFVLMFNDLLARVLKQIHDITFFQHIDPNV